MVTIRPFKGLRPVPELAAQVAALPYDVVNEAEARQYKDQKVHFYHVTRAEIDLAEGTDVHSQAVYEKACENLEGMIDEGILQEDADPCYYLYELTMDGRSQTGLICGSSCDDYFNNLVRKHEFTRPVKEKDRIDHIRTTRAQTGTVFLAYRDVPEIQAVMNQWKDTHAPVYDFTAEDGIQHRFWVIDDYAKVGAITHLFRTEVPCTYIADGHHRAASAGKVCLEMREAGFQVTGEERFNSFLTAIFPESELKILDYNRVAKDLNGLTPETFLAKVQERFSVEPASQSPYRPQQPHEFGMYLAGKWYRLQVLPEYAGDGHPIHSLDVSILQDSLLTPILNIDDPRTNNRIDFVGGIRGLQPLQDRVDAGEAAVAFSCYPVSIEQLLEVADSGEVMPPKSTWFEPKLRDGLVVYSI
ncbi:MAG: DUF1015 domain-containing protein [Sphingobacteriales bacterium]|nr:MAG: DUF1015 domain-containing protein [Sphingobacteriales bacterium]